MLSGLKSGLSLWGPVLAYMALIFYSSSRPLPPLFRETPDYLLHLGGYFVLGLLAVRAFGRGLPPQERSGAYLLGPLLAFLYAVTDEWHQSFVPGREASGLDLLADAMGASLAAAMVSLRWWGAAAERRGVEKVVKS
jgi:VanZ family protein